MTDLVIGEYYAWNEKRARILATGVVLKNYQHNGVQIEVPAADDSDTTYLYNVPAREIASTWDHFILARAKWEILELEKRDTQRAATNAKQRVMNALHKLELHNDVSASAYPGYIILTFSSIIAADSLADALYALADARGKAVELIQNRPGV